MLTHSSTQTDAKGPTQARLFKNDVIRVLYTIGIGFTSANPKKEREGVFVRLCDGNHSSSILGVADFRRVMAPRIKEMHNSMHQRASDRTTRQSTDVSSRGRASEISRPSRQSIGSSRRGRPSVDARRPRIREPSPPTVSASVNDESRVQTKELYESGDLSPHVSHVVRSNSADTIGGLDLDATMAKMMERVQGLTNHLKQHSFARQPSLDSRPASFHRIPTLPQEDQHISLPSRCEAMMEHTFSSLEELEAVIAERERDLLALNQEGSTIRHMEETIRRLQDRVKLLEGENMRLENELKSDTTDKETPRSAIAQTTLVDLLEGKGHLSGWREI